jgi:RNA polymerase sigma-70 factor (ECF subfamily)
LLYFKLLFNLKSIHFRYKAFVSSGSEGLHLCHLSSLFLRLNDIISTRTSAHGWMRYNIFTVSVRMDSKLTKIDNHKVDPATWMDLYGDLLYRFAYFRVKDSTAAEDIVQETFLAALGGYKNFKGRSTLRTWLIAILKNKSVDHIRKKVREQGSGKIEDLANRVYGNLNRQGEWPHHYCQWLDTPMKLYAQKELMDTLHSCLAELPSRLAEAFILREIDGLSTKEICEALKVTSTNCWVMLHRARRQLRACIGTYMHDSTA